jgi:hypothetical protein
MSLQENFEEVKAFDEGIIEFLSSHEGNNLTESSINKILHFIHVNNYLQVLYSYGDEVLTQLLSYFLDVENYAQCARIRDSVNNHNKATGEQIKLNP